MTDADIQRIAVAVADEIERRKAEKANITLRIGSVLPASIEAAIRRLSEPEISAGLHAIGRASLADPQPTGDHITQRIAAGFHPALGVVAWFNNLGEPSLFAEFENVSEFRPLEIPLTAAGKEIGSIRFEPRNFGQGRPTFVATALYPAGSRLPSQSADLWPFPELSVGGRRVA